jgi:RNA polymerase sigma-70 factor (ECF subfamily)
VTETTRETARLVEAARTGDREAFGTLYARYARMVHGVLLAHVTGVEVDDLVQDVFLHALERLPALRDPGAFGGWLAAIARTHAVDHHRRPRTESLPDDVPDSRPDRAEAVWVMTAIRALPSAYRETLTLRLVEGMTGPEIAARTGLTEGSVRVNLCRGMAQLRARLNGGPR